MSCLKHGFGACFSSRLVNILYMTIMMMVASESQEIIEPQRPMQTFVLALHGFHMQKKTNCFPFRLYQAA